MTDPFLSELSTECLTALNENPVLRSAGALDGVIVRNADKRRAAYRACFAALEELHGLEPRLTRLKAVVDEAFPMLGDEIYPACAKAPPAPQEPRRMAIDPYRSAALSMWMDGLNRGLDWIRRGADLSILDFALAPELLARDLRIERAPARVLQCGIGLVPASLLADSRIMATRLGQCVPGLPGYEYPELDAAGLDRLARHLDEAIGLIQSVDPAGYERMISCIHTFHVGVRRDPLCSFSSSNQLPGSSIVVLALDRLEDNDTIATAAQLLHEAGHVLLGLYVSSAETPLPTEPAYVSPYKNDLQALESVLHMAYTIPWECAVRMALLHRRPSAAKRSRETAFIIAYALRQIPLIDIARLGVARNSGVISKDLADVAAIPDWSARILALTERLLEGESQVRQAAHGRERDAVLSRQAWDTGQMYLRGNPPLDPRIRSVSLAVDGQSLTLDYDGVVHQVALDDYRPTGKNYGSYAEEAEAPAQLRVAR